MNPYQKLIERKRTWTPVQTTAGTVKEGAQEVLKRALAVRHMELPVGEFINEALATEVPPLARELLLSNVKDEEKHDLALGYIANAHGVDEKAEAEALRLRDAWTAHPDHTITKAMVAERDRLMYEGKAPELTFTRASRVPAFFEHSNNDLPQYA
jgi:hypothetical protein